MKEIQPNRHLGGFPFPARREKTASSETEGRAGRGSGFRDRDHRACECLDNHHY